MPDDFRDLDAAVARLAEADAPAPPTDAELDRVFAALAADRDRPPVHRASPFTYPAVAALAVAAVLALTLLVPTEPPPPTSGADVAVAELAPTPEPRTVELRMATGRDDLEVVWVMTENLTF